MKFSEKHRLFQKSAVAIFCCFMSVMLFVTYVAMTRQSGRTGQDPATIQQIRFQASNK